MPNISGRSSLHQALKALIIGYLEWMHVFGDPTDELGSVKALEEWGIVWRELMYLDLAFMN